MDPSNIRSKKLLTKIIYTMDQATIFISIIVTILGIGAAIMYGTAFTKKGWKRAAYALQGGLLALVALYLAGHLIIHLIQKFQ